MRPKVLFIFILMSVFCFCCQTKVEVYTTPSGPELESSEEVTPEPIPETAPAIYKLDVNITGNGKVTTDSELIPGELGTNTSFGVPAGTVLNFTATPDAGWKFDSWSDGCSGATCNIIVDDDKVITANFSETGSLTPGTPPHTLSPTLQPLTVRLRNPFCPHEVGVRVEPDGTSCTTGSAPSRNSCNYLFAQGTVIHLIPDPGPGCYSHWGEGTWSEACVEGARFKIVMDTGGYVNIDFDMNSSLEHCP